MLQFFTPLHPPDQRIQIQSGFDSRMLQFFTPLHPPDGPDQRIEQIWIRFFDFYFFDHAPLTMSSCIACIATLLSLLLSRASSLGSS
jgi:hypothetical protein